MGGVLGWVWIGCWQPKFLRISLWWGERFGHEKSGLLGPLGSLRVSWFAGWRWGRLFDAFFAEAGADGGTLAGFEFGVGFADDVDGALAFHDLAVGMAALGGGKG